MSGTSKNTNSSMEIPLNKLVTSEDNVRRTRKDSGIEELAASIAAHGLLENLVVRPVVDDARKPTGAYEVLAGGRRLAALQLLVKRKKLGATTSVHCNVRSDGSAKELSLAENAMREALHPADQFEAFRDLHEEFGFGAEEIAARFGVTARVVKERMKLASVSPRLLALYRQGDLTLCRSVPGGDRVSATHPAQFFRARFRQ